MVNILFLKKVISKFSLCCMKVKSLRQLSFIILISCSTCLLVLNKENELFLYLRISKMLSLGVFDRCGSY